MKVEQIFTGCLAEMAYYVSDNGEAAIIDPLRETEPYMKMAEADGSKIKWIFLTHFHADFVSGQVDLAKKTGATIVFGPSAKAGYDIHEGTDGELFPIGNINLKLLSTPGHTMESISLVLIDEKGEMPYVFSGDCLFIGDVGRPDLAVKSDLSQADLAGHLYDSLRNKIMTLPDDIIVYPNHGAGSACGKNMSSETFDTLKNQKATNYALRADMTKEEFVTEVLTGLKQPPAYFPINAGLNHTGTEKTFEDVMKQGMTALDVDTFMELGAQSDVTMLDTRNKAEYEAEGTVPGAIWIGLDGSFAPWVGALLVDTKKKIALITSDEAAVEESITRLARIGFDNTIGYLNGGTSAWKSAGKELDAVTNISASDLAAIDNATIVDARKTNEYLSEHVKGAITAPLDSVDESAKLIVSPDTHYVHCASGYRSLVFVSILQARGFKNLVNILGGYKDMKENEGFEMTDFVCPSTLS